ncbi:MAG: hypothetical protein R2695_18355 [Acidimicrobiales bacterium]
MKLLARADVVLALGTRLGPFGTLPPTRSRLLALRGPHHPGRRRREDARPGQEDRRRHLRRRRGCGAGLEWPVGRTHAGERRDLAERAATTAAEKAAWEAELDDWIEETDDFSVDMIKEAAAEEGSWLHPRQVLRELEKAMPPR